MMSCTQSIFWPGRGLPLTGHGVRNGRHVSVISQSSLHVSQVDVYPSNYRPGHNKVSSRLVYNTLKHERLTAVYAFGGKENGSKKNESFSWESLKKAMGGFKKELTVQDVLRERSRGFDGDGGDGNSRGGGGGGDGDGSGGPEDEGFAGILDEIQQVILAVLGVVFLYIMMIHGEELVRLARDYTKYLFGAKPSVRLRRTMDKFQRFYQSVAWKGVVRDDWLERTIIATPTWWHNPRQLAYLVDSYYRSYKNRGK